MKKGCFIKAVIAVTIIVAAIAYIIENHFDELILTPGKKFISGFVHDELEEKLAHVQEGPEKDSLKIILDDYIGYVINTKKKVNNKEIGKIADELNYILRDSVLTWEDVSYFQQYIDSVK